MRSVLRRSVEIDNGGSSPRSELVGLAELAQLDDPDEVLPALVRIARTLQAEDARRFRAAALRDLDSTVVHLERDLTLNLTRSERRRLLVRVMCELVAYGEDLAGDGIRVEIS